MFSISEARLQLPARPIETKLRCPVMTIFVSTEQALFNLWSFQARLMAR